MDSGATRPGEALGAVVADGGGGESLMPTVDGTGSETDVGLGEGAIDGEGTVAAGAFGTGSGGSPAGRRTEKTTATTTAATTSSERHRGRHDRRAGAAAVGGTAGCRLPGVI
ncbi:hypothetical protein ACQP2Y_10815 [Actinoplanes sp. CA-051413]|uniref:hypothetical protein n=1 Tax=Actinoplanes sp. CA-051413 TaxID=3239899 RepID=UPI003D9669EB